MAQLDRWLNVQRERNRQEMEVNALLGAAWDALRASEDQGGGGRELESSAIESDLDSLQQARLAFERRGKPLPAKLADRLGERCRILENKLRSRRRRRLVALGIGFSAVVAVLCSVGYYWRYEIRVLSFASRLNTLVQNRDVKDVEALLKQLREMEPRLLESAKLQEAEKTAKAFLTKEIQAYADYTNAFWQLPTEFSLAQLEETQSKLKHTIAQLALVAPALRSTEERRMEEIKARWSQHLEKRRQVVNQTFDPLLRELEQHLDSAAATGETESLRTKLPDVTEVVRRLDELSETPSQQAQVDPNWLARFKIAKGKYEKERQQLASYQQAVSKLNTSQVLEEFRSALAALGGSGFPMDKMVQAASQITPLVPTEEYFLASLLVPKHVEIAKSLKQNPAVGFAPKLVNPDAMSLFQTLRSQLALSSELIRYRVYLDSPRRTRYVDWIVVGRLKKGPGWETNRAYSTDQTTGDFELTNHECFSFDGKQMRIPLGGQSLPVEVEERGPCVEAGSFQALRIGQLFGSDGNAGTQPVFKILDGLLDSDAGSPLARAYILVQVIRLLEMQPADWGLPFAPIVPEWRDRLRAAGAEQIKPGDWFIPARITAAHETMAQTLGSLRSTSCADQANRLSSLTTLTLQSGMSLVGYVGVDGQPVFSSNALSGEIWGIASASRIPGLLYRGIAEGRSAVAITKGLPLTPLLRLNDSVRSLQSKARITAADKRFLPPLFTLSTDAP